MLAYNATSDACEEDMIWESLCVGSSEDRAIYSAPQPQFRSVQLILAYSCGRTLILAGASASMAHIPKWAGTQEGLMIIASCTANRRRHSVKAEIGTFNDAA